MKIQWLLLVSLLGCGKKPGSYEIKDAAQDAASDNMKTKADSAWEERGDKAKLQESLDAYEQVFSADPTNRDAATKLIRGYYLMGDIHSQEKSDKIEMWDRAITFGDACLNINENYKSTYEKSGDKIEAVKTTTVEDVPCIYWTASALGKWGKASGIAVLLRHKDTIYNFISQVESLQPDYFHGAVDRYWGAYYSASSLTPDFDLDKSQGHFQKSIENGPGNLATRILYVTYWADKTKGKDHAAAVAVFDEQLQYVMAADPEALSAPDLIPENNAEKAKAEALWAQRSDWFSEDPGEVTPLKEQPPVKVEEAPVEETPTEEASEEAPAEGSEEAPAEEGSEETPAEE